MRRDSHGRATGAGHGPSREGRPAAKAWLAAAAALVIAGPAGATVLDFDWTRDAGVVVPTTSPSDIPSDYGDRVTGPSVAVPGGQFLYTEAGEGYTPNVGIDIAGGGATATDPQARLWALSFGDLRNVVFGEAASQVLTVRLTAEPGFEAALYGFDLAGYPQRDWTIASVQVWAGASLLFEQRDAFIRGAAGPDPAHTAFAFSSPLVGAELLIRIDYSNLAPSRQDNIGFDNLRFGQLPPSPVPEPATAWMMLAALLLGWLRCRDGAAPTGA